MALIRCPECGREISSRAKACPHCGFPMDDVVKPEEEPLTIEPLLERRKASIVASVFLFIFLELLFLGAFIFCVVLSIYKPDYFKSFVVLFIVLMLIFGSEALIAIAGLVVTIIDRTKNNNRLDKDLIKYDNEQKILIFYSFKDIELSIDPSKVQRLDGNSKAFLYYIDESKNNKTKMISLGYANKDDIQRARNRILALQSLKNPEIIGNENDPR